MATPTISSSAITYWPTVDQMALMDQLFEPTSITASDTKGTIGMYGENDKYYFYMAFTADEDDEWWTSQVVSKNFRVIFQMGNTLSDWTGVQLAMSSSDDVSTITATAFSTLD